MKTALMRPLAAILIIFTALVLPGCGPTAPDSVKAYLADRARPLDLKQTLDSEAFGNTEGYRVFLIGETHAKAKSKQAEKLLIRHFYENEGVRYLLWEVGLGAGIALDRYLQTGDHDELDFYFEQLDGTFAHNREEYDFWKWLQAFNAGLPQEGKLHVIGLDVDHQPAMAARGLSLLLDGPAPTGGSLGLAWEKAEEGDVKALEELGQAVKEHPDEAKAAFGDSYEWAERLFENFSYTIRYYSGSESERQSKSNDLRDEAMMANFLFALNEYPQETFLGEFGSEHVIQSACETQFCSVDYNRFAMRLDAEDSPVKGAVRSILLAYTEQGFAFLRSYSPSDGDLDYRALSPWFGQDALFSLDEPQSPFLTEEYLVKHPADPEASTADHFQKLMLLSDSEDCTPFEP